MQCAWQVEIDPFCQQVLAKHWPDVERLENVKECGRHNLRAVDLICGGFPCQDVSIAGRREGLAGKRSGLWFEFHRIIDELRPQWVVIENVPGLLSSNGGRDMGTIIGGLAELGYWWAYRVLDAQYFGVPQRRRRVFIVGCLTRGCAQEVLFERESSPWDIAPGRETGQSIAKTFTVRTGKPSGGRGYCEVEELSMNLGGQPQFLAYGGNNTQGPVSIATSCNAHPSRRYDFESETFICHENKQGDLTPAQQARALRSEAGHSYQFICNTFNGYTGGADDNDAQGGHLVACLTPWDAESKRIHNSEFIAPTLAGSDGKGGQRFPNFATPMGVIRRLTPIECERLQGFPDGWTAGQSDSVRYRQLGNAVAVPVAEWLGRRLISYST